MKPDFGAVSNQRITTLRPSLKSHIKTANEARAIVGRLEYALQLERREDAHAIATQAKALIDEIIEATK